MLKRKRSGETEKSKEELLRNVAQRLARANQEMSAEEILDRAERAVKILKNV